MSYVSHTSRIQQRIHILHTGSLTLPEVKKQKKHTMAKNANQDNSQHAGSSSKTETIRTWMPYRITDMREDCIGRSLEFKAMYINLLEEMWRNNCQLDDDEEYLMTVSGASRTQWIKNRQALANLFYITNGNWNHNRLREAFNKASGISESRRAAAKVAINARWDKERAAKEMAKSVMEKITQDGTAY